MKCILCGCTDVRACDDGCAWLTTDPPICTTHVEELVVDALRWRAFMSSERIAFLGSGGKGATMHIGLEIWGKYPQDDKHGRELVRTSDARKVVTKYADARRKESYT
jgi:hypothetical protein